jgi:hypothetical protein
VKSLSVVSHASTIDIGEMGPVAILGKATAL